MFEGKHEQISGHEMMPSDPGLEPAPFIIEITEPPPATYKKYGNLKVLLETRLCVLTLGPDYCFFLPAFLFFVITGFFVTNYIFSTTENIFLRGITFLICTFQPIAYLVTALSDPGVITQSEPQDPNETNNDREMRIRECVKCGIDVPRFTHHCEECDVCVRDYDHHCPWVSKCIGGRNLTAFNVFLAATSVFMLYCIVAVVICTAINSVKFD